MRQITTRYIDHRKQTDVREILPDPAEEDRELLLVNLYPQVKYQSFIGFGGAFTDAAGYVFQQMPKALQDEVAKAYYSPQGLGYSLGRTTLDSCDFSLNCYDSLGGREDRTLSCFDVNRAAQYTVPLMKNAQEACGQSIPMMLTPWSPPAWMKTNGERVHGGEIKPECRGLWAEYICRYIEAYRALGVNVCALSAQNEPKAAQTWDSCQMTAEQESMFIREYLAPTMEKHGLDDVKLLIWDHNKERAFDRACAAITDERMKKLVSGVAVHWYSGDHFDALQMLRERYPELLLVFSEACVEYSRFAGQSQLLNAQMYAHELIGNLNHGLNAFLDWNLLLDEKGGPNHVGNLCEAPIMYDTQKEKLIYNLSYDYIGHFSRYIKPGARRIGLTTFGSIVEVTAFENPDGSIATVMMNRQEHEQNVYLRMNGRVYPVVQPAQSISTYLF